MTRQEAIEHAKQWAKALPQSYYSEPFMPHEWVIEAIIAASVKAERIEPTYYVTHPDGSYSVADPQPRVHDAG
jgi:hypothetical protein